MAGRYGDDSGGNALAMVAGAGFSALNFLLGFQALLNLQFLPSQLSDFTLTLATTFNLSLPQVSGIFFAGGAVGFFIGFATGRVTA